MTDIEKAFERLNKLGDLACKINAVDWYASADEAISNELGYDYENNNCIFTVTQCTKTSLNLSNF